MSHSTLPICHRHVCLVGAGARRVHLLRALPGAGGALWFFSHLKSKISAACVLCPMQAHLKKRTFFSSVACSAQAALFRSASKGELAQDAPRALNAVAGVCIALLVLDGRAQTNAGAELYATLEPGNLTLPHPTPPYPTLPHPTPLHQHPP